MCCKGSAIGGRSREACTAAEWLAEELDVIGGPDEAAARARAVVRLRELLGDERFDVEWEAGRVRSFEEAIALAQVVAVQAGAEVELPRPISDFQG